MSIINQTVGAVIGLVTGVVTAVMKMLYVYYVSDRTLKEAGYRWYVRIPAFIPLGTVALACTIPMIFIKSFSTIYMGIRTGWKEGIIAAFKFPVCLHANSKIKRNRHLETKSVFFKWRIELAHLAKAGLQEEAVAKMELICKIKALLSPAEFIPNITPKQIQKFKNKMPSLQHDSKQSNQEQSEILKIHETINQYIDRCGQSFTKFHQRESGDSSICPVTIEYKSASGKIWVQTYHFDVLIEELEQAQRDNNTDILKASTQTTLTIPLDPDEAVLKNDGSLHFAESVKMYRGYYPGIEAHILTTIGESSSQLNADGSTQESKQSLNCKPISRTGAIHKIQELSNPAISGSPITSEEIKQFESVMMRMKEVPPEIKVIADYIKRGCVLSNRTFIFICKNTISCPITIEWTGKNDQTIYTYNYLDFIPSLMDPKWGNDGSLLYAPAERVSDKIPLDLANCFSDPEGNLHFGQHVIMYRGYYQKLKEIVLNTITSNQHLLVPEIQSSSRTQRSRLHKILTSSSTAQIIASSSQRGLQAQTQTAQRLSVKSSATLQSQSTTTTHERRYKCSPVDAGVKIQEKIKTILDQIQKESSPESKESPASPETFLLDFLQRIIDFLNNINFSKKLTLTLKENTILKAMLEIVEYMDPELVNQIQKDANANITVPDFLTYLPCNNEQTKKLVLFFKEAQKYLLHSLKRNTANKICELLHLPTDVTYDFLSKLVNNEPNSDFLPMCGLTSKEIQQFDDIRKLDMQHKAREQLKITGNIDPKLAANLKLSSYLNTSCPISKKQLSELHNEVDFKNNQRVTSPVTIEYTPPEGNIIVCTYQFDAFIKKLLTDAEDPAKFTLDFVTHDPSSQLKLTNDNFKIYRGYYKKLDVSRIREVIKLSQETPEAPQEKTLSPSP